MYMCRIGKKMGKLGRQSTGRIAVKGLTEDRKIVYKRIKGIWEMMLRR